MIQTLPVPLNTPVYRNVDGEAISDDGYEAIDCYIDERGYTNRRPGLSLFSDIGLGANNGIDGMFWWTHQNMAMIVSGGRLLKLTYPSSVATITDLTIATFLQSGVRPSFASDGTNLYVANGTQIKYTNGSSSIANIGDADAPTSVSHIAYLDGYILATNNDNKFYWSDLNSGTSWDALNFASAVGNPDKVIGLYVMAREVFLFGQNSVEIWENDGENPFSRTPGGYIETGCLAAHSPVVTDVGIFWLTSDRRIAKYYNGNLTKISTPYDREIENFSTLSDCFGMKITIKGKPFLVFCFPSEGRTLVFNLEGETSWTEWKRWIPENLEYERWLGNAYCYSPDWGLHLVGARHNSYIYDMSSDYDDDDGEKIRGIRRTGHIDFGTTKLKRTNEFRLRARRGVGMSSGTPKLMLRWKTDNKNWSNEHSINLGDQGESSIVYKKIAMGFFRTKQYEISFTDAVPILFGSAEEDVEVLR